MIDSGENSGDFVMLFDNKSTNKGKNQLNTKLTSTEEKALTIRGSQGEAENVSSFV